MKPEEVKTLVAWAERHETTLLVYACWSIIASVFSGGIYDAHTDDQPLMVGIMFTWPVLLPPVLLALNSAVYRLRTRTERRMLTVAQRRIELERLEKELLDA